VEICTKLYEPKEMIRLRNFLKPYLKECIVGPVFKLAEAILELLLPTVMAFIVNNGVLTGDADYIIRYGILTIVMAILGFGCSCVCQYFASRASQCFGTDVRNALFSHIWELDASQADKFGTASLSSRLVNDVNNLQLAVAMLIRLVIRAPFICLGAVVMAMMLNFRLGLILLALIPIFALLLIFIIKASSPLYTSVLKTLDRITSKVREVLSGVRLIRAFSKEDDEKESYDKLNDDYTAQLNRVGKISALLSPFTTVVVNLAVIVILYRGGAMLETGDFLIGDILAFVNYASQILLAMIVISNIIGIFTRAGASGVRVREILNTSTTLEHGDNVPECNDTVIEFENVSFAYNKGTQNVVENVSFSVKKGERIGIIGGTGSGKTTLVSLMMYEYAADNGTVRIMGKDIKSIAGNHIEKLISCVPQRISLLSGTVRENISMSKKLSDGEIKNACDIAQISSHIEALPDGYDSKVARGGKNFSGGQRQRLCIARALAKHSDVLILDDSTSALDFTTERNLRNALNSSLPDTAVITVSQRVSSIKHCDKIIMLNDGKTEGIGTHRELFASCPSYRDICMIQLSAEELEVLGK